MLGQAILSFIERLSFLRRLKCTSIIEKGPQSVSFIIYTDRGFFSIVSFIQIVHYQRFYSYETYPSGHHEDVDGAVGVVTVSSSEEQQVLVVVIDIATGSNLVYRNSMKNTLCNYRKRYQLYVKYCLYFITIISKTIIVI